MKPMVFMLTLGMFTLSNIAVQTGQAQTLPVPGTAVDEPDDRTPVVVVGTGLGANAGPALVLVVSVVVAASGGDDGGVTTTTTTGGS